MGKKRCISDGVEERKSVFWKGERCATASRIKNSKEEFNIV